MRRLLLTFAAFFVLITPANAAWTWPVSGEVITPYRNGSDPYATGQHRGIDIAAPVGAAVRAAAGGDVRFAGTAGSSGVTISIRTAGGYDTSYLHLSALEVRAGAHVSAGDRIGAVGTTGSAGTRSATAPHLHFGVRDAGTRHSYHDPLAFLPPAPPAGPAPEPPVPAPAPRPEPSVPDAAPLAMPGRRPGLADAGADGRGLDVGWLLACAGLLLAAAVLGLTEDGRGAITPARSSPAGRVDGRCRTT
jgi:hypothetical protein